jgi:hypothetical protein
MKLILHGKPGSRKKLILLDRLPLLVEELGVATPERIRQIYRRKHGEPVGWNTVARYLRALVNEGILEEQILTSGKTRNTVMYRLKR